MNKTYSVEDFTLVDLYTNNLLATLERAAELPSVKAELSKATWYVDYSKFTAGSLFFLSWMDLLKCMSELGHTFRSDSQESLPLLLMYLKTEKKEYVSYDNIDELISRYGEDVERLFSVSSANTVVDISRDCILSLEHILFRAGFPKIRSSYIFLLYQMSNRISKADTVISMKENQWMKTLLDIRNKVLDSDSLNNKPFSPFLHESDYDKEYAKFENQGFASLKVFLDSKNKTIEKPCGSTACINDGKVQDVQPIVSLKSENGSLKSELVPPVESILEKKDENLLSKDYDPTLDLNYACPSFDMFKSYGEEGDYDREDIENSKQRISCILKDFGIDVEDIDANPGPSFTSFEIKLKNAAKIRRANNLKDEIAITISGRAGTRILAPIPGTSMLGIEMPNNNLKQFSLRYCVRSKSYNDSNLTLPIIIGKRDLFEPLCIDLTKSPHLLVAGVSGQGKSTWLNTLILSLISQKHPSLLKFVLIDPKRIEFSLFEKLDKHYLACRADQKHAVECEDEKAIDLLESVVTEMEDRFALLQDAECRNISEYNRIFAKRQLDPRKRIVSNLGSSQGSNHHYLPYIVVVIDEYSGIIGKNKKVFESVLSSLVQKSHIVGIHLIIATNQLSSDVITPVIKSNFQTRLAFKVLSNRDSKLIIDQDGAQNLIGPGDVLLMQDKMLSRVQCPYTDAEEINAICKYVFDQPGYPFVYLLPDKRQATDIVEESNNVDLNNLDPLFEEVAELVVVTAQGSTSMVQRKFGLGYSRACRIMDQLEAAGIVGPYNGSKAREVFVDSDSELNRILLELRK